jgi:GDPmannose 4,6-dehydratase
MKVFYSKTAIVTGITGQDGAYLSKLLIEKSYRVIGIIRNNATNEFKGLEYLNILENIVLEECDLLNFEQVSNIIKKYNPDEIYNLAAQSSVSFSFAEPIETFSFNTISVFNLLENVKQINKNIKYYQASSSEMYGNVNEFPITEESLIHPVSPYAISKAASHWTCVNYRETYNMFITCGILFNHESYLRRNSFFFKKIITNSLDIYFGKKSNLIVGNIDIKRDFGYAPIYVEAMYLMMQNKVPTNYIVCSGISISLRQIIEYIFEKLNLNKNLIIVDKNLFRPNEIDNIYGDSKKAQNELAWSYDLSIQNLIDILLEEELLNNENYKDI